MVKFCETDEPQKVVLKRRSVSTRGQSCVGRGLSSVLLIWCCMCWLKKCVCVWSENTFLHNVALETRETEYGAWLCFSLSTSEGVLSSVLHTCTLTCTLNDSFDIKTCNHGSIMALSPSSWAEGITLLYWSLCVIDKEVFVDNRDLLALDLWLRPDVMLLQETQESLQGDLV